MGLWRMVLVPRWKIGERLFPRGDHRMTIHATMSRVPLGESGLWREMRGDLWGLRGCESFRAVVQRIQTTGWQ